MPICLVAGNNAAARPWGVVGRKGADMGKTQLVTFRGWKCRVDYAKYANGRTAMQLVDVNTGESVAMVTVNLPDAPLAEGYVFIKDWSENEGVLDALDRAGVVKATARVVPTGYVMANEARVLEVPA